MADDRTIVYGLGRIFAKFYAQIHEDYNVIGYCDADSVNRKRFACSLALEELASKASSYDILLVTPRQGFDIAIQLVKKYGVESSKIHFLHQPEPTPSARGKRHSILPDVVLHGIYQEDMAILYLCNMLDLDYKNLHYCEAGLSNVIKSSATYCLYRKGARGLLMLQPYADYEKQAKVYRHEDEILEICSTSVPAILERKNSPHIISLHEECSTETWLEIVYEKKPRILTVIARESSLLLKIIAHGYTLFTTLQGTCAVFYLLGEDV